MVGLNETGALLHKTSRAARQMDSNTVDATHIWGQDKIHVQLKALTEIEILWGEVIVQKCEKGGTH